MSETEGEDEEISKFAAAAIRARKKGTFEQILSQHLILSVTAKPLKKIRLIAEAAMMVSDKIENHDELKGISRVARAFESASYVKLDQWGTTMWFVPWDFPSSKENFDTLIKPWYVPVSYFSKYIKLHRQEVWEATHDSYLTKCKHVLATAETKEELQKTVKKLLKTEIICPKCEWDLKEREIHIKRVMAVTQNPLWSFFFEMSRSCLSEVGFKRMRNAFINYALPKVQEAVKTLSALVTPQQYQDMVKLLTKQREGYNEGHMGPIE